MSIWQSCTDMKDAVPLYPSHGLYLKPVALLHVSVRLPLLKVPEKAVSNYEIMEKLKNWIQPEAFLTLKVSKSSLEFVRFDGEIANKSKIPYVLSRLDGKSIKLSGVKDQLKVRAVEAKTEFPSKYDWDSFFRDSKDMNEMKAGERPDTVYFGNLPCEWFSLETDKPSERLLRKVFEQFGAVRRIDVPMLDPYRNQMNCNISGVKQFTFNQNVIFEIYVQFEEYFCFVKCMDAFRGMKLVFIDKSKNPFATSIKVDYDKSKHLSDASVHRRCIVRERLEKKESERFAKELKQKEAEEKLENERKLQKLERRKLREQKRKEKQLEKLKLKEVEDMNKKIAVEEYLLLMAQRKLESIRLLSELMDRVKTEKEKELASSASMNFKRKRRYTNSNITNDVPGKKLKENSMGTELNTEKDLRYKLIQKFKKMQQEELKKEKGRLQVLATDGSTSLKNTPNMSPLSMSSNSDIDTDMNIRLHNDCDLSQRNSCNRFPNRKFWPNNRGRCDRQFIGKINGNSEDFQNNRGRFNRNRRGYGRQYSNSWRGQYSNQCVMPIVDSMLLTYSHEYYRYLKKMARESKRSRSSSRHSYSRSRSRSRSRNRTRSRSRSRTRSRSRSRTRSYIRDRNSRSRSRSRSRTHSRKRSYTRSRSRCRTRSRNKDKSRSWSRSKSKSTIQENKRKNSEETPVDGNSKKTEEKINFHNVSNGDEKHKKSKKPKKKKKKEKCKRDDEKTK